VFLIIIIAILTSQVDLNFDGKIYRYRPEKVISVKLYQKEHVFSQNMVYFLTNQSIYSKFL